MKPSEGKAGKRLRTGVVMDPIEGIDHQAVVLAMRSHGHHDVSALDALDAAREVVWDRLEPGDLVITFGAGDVWKAGTALVERLETETLEGPAA